MAEEKKINMTLTASEVKGMLVKHLDIKQADSVANVIIGHMVQTDKGLGHLFKALVGLFPTAQYTPGQFVWIKSNAVSTWKYDMAATKQLPNFKDEAILGQIIGINVYEGYPYKIAFEAIKTNEKKPSQETMTVDEPSIIEKAEDFTDILDDLEKMKDDADLPF